MVMVKRRVSEEDLFRLGVYTQIEGNFRASGGTYRFTYYLQQISDMENLISRVVDIPVDAVKNRTYIQFYSKPLYESLLSMGFYKFKSGDWNVPRAYMRSESYKKEYLRAVVDSLGSVDIDKSVPYVRVHSVNETGLRKVHEIYGGRFFSSKNNSFLQWKGKEAINICEYLDYKFNCYRNQRGAEIMKNIKLENFVW